MIDWQLNQSYSSTSGRASWDSLGEAGSEPVVLLHGTPFSSYVWRGIARSLDPSVLRSPAIDATLTVGGSSVGPTKREKMPLRSWRLGAAATGALRCSHCSAGGKRRQPGSSAIILTSCHFG